MISVIDFVASFTLAASDASLQTPSIGSPSSHSPHVQLRGQFGESPSFENSIGTRSCSRLA